MSPVLAMQDAGFIIGSYVVTFGVIAVFAWRSLRAARQLSDRVDDDHKYWA
jgi:heme exporter protein CcmD